MGVQSAEDTAVVADTRLKKPEALLKSETPKESGRLRVLDLDIDRASGTVYRAGHVLDLPDLSYRLLTVLAERAPAIVGKDELISAVWGNVVVSDETLMQRVRLLRQAIGDDGQEPRYIASVRGRGYRMLAPVDPAAPPDQSGGKPEGRSGRTGLMAVSVLIVAVLAAIVINWPSGPEEATVPRLAVLPFEDLSEGGNYRYFADGVHEELLARLGSLNGVQVISRTTMQQFRDTRADVPAIARELGATDVIEGSVRVSGDELRITVQLIDAATDEHRWVESFDRRLTVENVFDIQEAVAARVADVLAAGTVQPQPIDRELPTENTQAYELYLLGRWHTFRLTPEGTNRGAELLERAVSLDPGFAEAWATLGWAYSFMGARSGGVAPLDVFPLARDAALRALQLDDSLASAHAVYADVLTWYEWDFETAETEHLRTIELDPTQVLSYALYLSIQHRHVEALELMDRRLSATPDDEWVTVNLGWRLLHAGLFDEALAAVADISSHADAASVRGHALIALGQYDEAAAQFEEEIDRRGRAVYQVSNLAISRFLAGRRAEGEALLDELETAAEDGYVSPLAIALVYFAAGNEDRGYELLDDAIDQRARGVIFIGVNPLLLGEHSDRRFRDALARIGLPLP